MAMTKKEMAPSIESARKMGEEGGPAVEAERLAFEAWMDGHCWPLGATWNGRGYVGNAERGDYVDQWAMRTRELWAAWRDRAALARHADSGDDTATIGHLQDACLLLESIVESVPFEHMHGWLRSRVGAFIGRHRQKDEDRTILP